MDAANLITKRVESAQLVDFHTHIVGTAHPLNKIGPVSTLRYHYSVCDYLRTPHGDRTDAARFLAAPAQAQADAVWQSCFDGRPVPLTTTETGVRTLMARLGVPSYKSWQEHFAGLGEDAYLDQIFELAGLKAVCMTNDLSDPAELKFWLDPKRKLDPRFLPCLRLDGSLGEGMLKTLTGLDYDVTGAKSAEEYRRFISDWIRRMKPVYAALSLPSSWRADSGDRLAALLREAVIPAAEELGVPVALMVGVRRQINPALGDAGDAVGPSDVASIEYLASRFKSVRFFVTLLHEADQYPLAVTARKFNNIIPFGCWWWLNTPQQIERITRLRIDLIGDSFIWQHSDARISDQLIYKWAVNRRMLSKVLIRHLADLAESGVAVNEEQAAVMCDAFTGAAERYLNLKF